MRGKVYLNALIFIEQANMSCFVLCSGNVSMSVINQSYQTAREAKNNFMPSIAKKPILYSKNDPHSSDEDSFIHDPDF